MVDKCSMSELSQKDLTQYDEIWYITRSSKNLPNIQNGYHVQQLSPSVELFNKYLAWKEQGLWNSEKFFNEYVPQFLLEIKNSPEAKTMLNQLVSKGISRNILLVCFCSEETMCHRSIVHGLVSGVYKKYHWEHDYTYIRYYEMYENLSVKTTKSKSFIGDRYFLSNMYPCNVTIAVNGKSYTFLSAESAFQSCKCLDRIEEFTNIDGYQAKKLGRQVSLRSDWNEVRIQIMKIIVKAKFDQNKDLIDKLLQIQGDIVEENTWNDTFWGVCNGVGENQLGKILIDLRDYYKSQSVT